MKEETHKKQMMPRWKLALNGITNKSATWAMAVSLTDYARVVLRGKKKKKVEAVLRQFVPSSRWSDKAYLRRLVRDMLYSRRRYLVSYTEYFLFHFEQRDDADRKSFVGEFEKKQLAYSLHSDLEVRRKFFDKYLAYQTFKPYYRREMIYLEKEADFPALRAFADRHPVFLLKALDKAEGQDIFLFDLHGGESPSAVLDIVRDTAGTIFPCVAEEAIVQDPAMAAFHPQSVNTIRFGTFLRPDKVVPMFAVFRTGVGENVVDNACAGGICSSVDLLTGVIRTDGVRENGATFTKHPDTGKVFKGTQIPRWDELLSLVFELARVVPEQKYVGWDLALTPEGWCMVEGNDRAMFIGQMAEQKGIRPVIEETFLWRGGE